MDATQNIRIRRIRPLPTPKELELRIPMSEISTAVVAGARTDIANILLGKDTRRVVADVGPCSIHNEEDALEYACKMADLRRRVQDRIVLVMRTYFEKPRTTVGWKGLINDPHMDDSNELGYGLELARRIAQRVTDMGVPIVVEALDPFNIRYISGFVSHAVIGARTTESQTHREMASGLSMPVGFKNGTDGSIDIAINAIRSARAPHTFTGINSDGRVSSIMTIGNDTCHVILRGGDNMTNFDSESITRAQETLVSAGLSPRMVIDCSHGNSQKKHENQPLVLQEIIRQRKDGNVGIVGFMLESNLCAGRQDFPQDLSELRPGVSVTDACIDWDTTEQCVMDAYESLTS